MDRNSLEIITCCALGGLVSLVVLTWGGVKNESVPSLECSVDGVPTFVAYDVTSWDMRGGTLVVRSEEIDDTYVTSRNMLAGETCRDVSALSR